MNRIASLEERTIARAAGVVMAGFVVSNLTGLVKWVLVSQAFGTSGELDAFNAANRLPEMLFNLMAGGALASAFVPTFTGFLTRGDRAGAWRLASSIGNLLFLVLASTAALAWLFAPWLIPNIVAPGLDPGLTQLGISLMRILLLSAVIFGLSGLLMGILNAHQHFLLPALAPTFLWLGWILGVLVLVPRMGIHGLAWGVVLGAGMHLGVQVPGLLRRQAFYELRLGLGDSAVRRVGSLMAPRLVGVAVVQLNFLVNTILASGMREGSLSALQYSFFIMLMPQVVIAQAIAIAALPTFSAQAAQGAFDRMRGALAVTLRGVIFLSLPASLGLILLRRPIVAMLFQRGAFDLESTSLVAWSLMWFTAGLVGHALVEILSRAFYALEDTRTPVILGSVAMSLNVGLSLAFAALFRRWGVPPHGGLALANSLATGLEAAGLLWLMRGRLGGLGFPRVRRGLLASAVAAGVMVVSLVAWQNLSVGSGPWLTGGGGVVVGAAVYWLTALVLNAPEAKGLPALLLRREDREMAPSAPRPQGDNDLGRDEAEEHPDEGLQR